ncbi:MAG: IS630 family transposase [Candidatus Didemnitutus sp.]|nr:IS630 family transposase [Candidatus Didemnitutus sp.]
MARKLPELGERAAAELAAGWREHAGAWARQRLMVMKLVAQHELSAAQIAEAVGVGRSTVFRYLDKFLEGGVKGLLHREHKGGPVPTLQGAEREVFLEQLRQGRFRRAKEAQAWIKEHTKRDLALSSVYTLLGKAGGVLKVPRKTHAKKDPLAAEIFKFTLPERLAEASVGAERVRLWVLDEHRYGLLPVIRRCWSLRGVRVHAPYATKYQWGYLHEAMEVDGDNRMELFFTPSVDQDTHALFLRQIGETDPHARHIVIADQAGFHLKPEDPRVPPNLRLLPLPPYCPELNPVEKLGDLVKDRICNQLFDKLPALERAILAELAPLRECGRRVAQLIGHGWLLDQVNAGAPA